MTRPYYNRVSKEGSLNLVDTRIKRKDVGIAIEKLVEYRNSIASSLITGSDDTNNMIFRLPPEIRNKIYRFALPISHVPLTDSGATTETTAFKSLRTSLTTLEVDTNVKSSSNNRARDSGTSLFYLCKQITFEARSLMERFDVAYIPVLSSMNDVDLISKIVHHKISSLSPLQSTIFTAITSFSNVHIHLHVNYLPSGRGDDPEPYIDSSNAFIYGRIRQLLIMFICASASNFRHLESNNIKRMAIVHFDHFFSDWRYMHAIAGCYKFKHLVQIMGDDTNTKWDIRYYVHTGGQMKAQEWSEWDERLTKEFECLREECRRFPNIKLTAEVYGELQWSLEGQTEGVTRCITPSSTLWPSWPDDVSWRRFERVRSDEALS